MNQTVYPFDALCVTHNLSKIKKVKESSAAEQDDPDPGDWDMTWGYVTGGYYGDFDDDEVDILLKNKKVIESMIKPYMLCRPLAGEDPCNPLTYKKRFRHLFQSVLSSFLLVEENQVLDKRDDDEIVDMKVCWYNYE
jgi:hypothetical protein